MTKHKRDVVKKGGVAREDADVEDVTRDTYGSVATGPVAEKRHERIARADRAAGSAGVAGVKIPESREPEPVDDARLEEEHRRTEHTGDRMAPRRDAERLRALRRRQTRR